METKKPILESIYIKLLLGVILVLVASQFVISRTTPKPTWEWSVPKGSNYERQFTKTDAQVGNTATLVVNLPINGVLTINRLWADDAIVSIYKNKQDVTSEFKLSVPFGESVQSLEDSVVLPITNATQLKITIENTQSDAMGMFINFSYE